MRSAYLGGAPAVMISGLAWLAADAAWYIWGGFWAYVAIFVCGMMIIPLALLVSRAFRAPRVGKDNPLSRLGFETTFPLFAGLLIAFGLLPASENFAFAALAVIIGARYFAFATLYRDRLYWVLGTLLFLIGTGFAIREDVMPFHITLAVGAAELLFGAFLFTRWNGSTAKATA